MRVFQILISPLARAAAVGAALFIYAGPAVAQTSVPNPLRGGAAEGRAAEERAPRTPRAKPAEKAEAPAKPARERSAKQKENDDMMRACGASWRADKVALQAKGETWRSYLKDCRAKLKKEQKA